MHLGKPVAFLALTLMSVAFADPTLRFREDFEGALDAWQVLPTATRDVVIRELPGDAHHHHALALIPNGDVLALIRGSEKWGGVRIEGEVQFPTAEDNYLGVIYNYRKSRARSDFGLIYIKGNGSYLEVNPHRDLNVGRTLYPEYHTPLTGAAAIRIGEWQTFKVEVIGEECHFYVGDMSVPQLTFSQLDLDSGSIGLQPRSVGGEVLVDNVIVYSIDRFSYEGTAIPEISYTPAEYLSSWEVSGPYDRSHDEIARNRDEPSFSWRAFKTDGRGAIVSGAVTDYQGSLNVAYFRATFESEKDGEATLHINTVDDLALWVNGRFHWFIPRDDFAWFDFFTNPKHKGQEIPIDVRKGRNQIVLRVRGGVYASGGFYARIKP